MSILGALASAAVDEANAVAEAPNPIIPAMDEVIWGTLSFLILFAVMAKFAYPALKKAMDAR